MEQNKSSIGSTIGTIIIIAIIILGGLYFWGKRIEESRAKENLITNFTPGTGEAIATTPASGVSPADDLNSIDADLNSTNLDNIAPELK